MSPGTLPGDHRPLAWISSLPLTPAGGGTLAVNYRAHEALARYFTILDSPPIPVRADAGAALLSKVRRRVFGRAGSFPVFSRSRLEDNAREITARLTTAAELVFFKGVTPWTAWKPDRPYVAYTDIAFATFFENTFSPEDFHRKDIGRIVEGERAFLEGAAAVFFESQWGLEKTRSTYDLAGTNFVKVGRGGNLPVPEGDQWDGKSLQLVTMAKHFRQKGGDLVLAAYRTLKAEFPGLSWSILGGKPDFDWKGEAGVTWEGFLNPAEPSELARIESLLANAWLLVHPTREDTNPLVITEAAGFGCPTITVDRFALPELVDAGRSGIIIPSPPDEATLTTAIRSLLEDRDRYEGMRAGALSKAKKNGDWEAVSKRIVSVLGPILDPP